MNKLLDGDEADNHVERRWFAATKAVNDMRVESKTLNRVVELARHEQREVTARLAELEAICIALGEEVMSIEAREEHSKPNLRRISA